MGQGRNERMIERMRRRVVAGSGRLDPAKRRAAYGAELAGFPDVVGRYIDKVHREAYNIVDSDVDAVRATGFDDDEIYELTMAAATGAGLRRLDIAMRAMKGS